MSHSASPGSTVAAAGAVEGASSSASSRRSKIRHDHYFTSQQKWFTCNTMTTFESANPETCHMNRGLKL